jgi:hypothetical protein
VRSLAEQHQTVSTPLSSTGSLSTSIPGQSLGGTAPSSIATNLSPSEPQVRVGERQHDLEAIRKPLSVDGDAFSSAAAQALPSPAASDPGSMPWLMHSHGTKYVSSVHWAAVLESVSELKDQYEKEREEEPWMEAANAYGPMYSPGPRLLYEPVHVTKEDMLALVPARPLVDRMISRYFNLFGMTTGKQCILLSSVRMHGLGPCPVTLHLDTRR